MSINELEGRKRRNKNSISKVRSVFIPFLAFLERALKTYVKGAGRVEARSETLKRNLNSEEIFKATLKNYLTSISTSYVCQL